MAVRYSIDSRTLASIAVMRVAGVRIVMCTVNWTASTDTSEARSRELMATSRGSSPVVITGGRVRAVLRPLTVPHLRRPGLSLELEL